MRYILLLVLLYHSTVSARVSARVSPRGISLSNPLRSFRANMRSSLTPSLTQSSASASDDPLRVSKDKRVGVLLLNLGGPEKQEDVQGFLYNLFADPDIIQLPQAPCPLGLLQKPLAYSISKNRAKKSAAAYQSIGGGSPIKKYTTAQAEGLRQNLLDRGYSKVKTYFAMRYWEPYTEDVLAQIKRDGIQELVIIPLYPHYSISTSASSLKLINKIFEKDPKAWFKGSGSGLLERCTVVPYWYNRPEYITAMAELIADKYTEYTREQREQGVDVLYSAHGVPQSYIATGDPYKQHMEDCVKLISTRVGEIINERMSDRVDTYLPGPNGTYELTPSDVYSSPAAGDKPDKVTASPLTLRCQLAFQSRVGPVEWLRPYTDDKLREMGSGGVKNLIVVPVAFVSEHIETLEEIDIEYRELAEEVGIENWKRAPALNTDPRFINDLASMTEEALMTADVSISETLVAQLLPSTKKKSRLPYVAAVAAGGVTAGTALTAVAPYVKRRLLDVYGRVTNQMRK